MVLTVAAFALLNPARALHKFNRLNPFDHFESELVFDPQSHWSAMESRSMA